MAQLKLIVYIIKQQILGLFTINQKNPFSCVVSLWSSQTDMIFTWVLSTWWTIFTGSNLQSYSVYWLLVYCRLCRCHPEMFHASDVFPSFRFLLCLVYCKHKQVMLVTHLGSVTHVANIMEKGKNKQQKKICMEFLARKNSSTLHSLWLTFRFWNLTHSPWQVSD